MKTIAVTGASGFIGSGLVATLKSSGQSPVSLVRRSDSQATARAYEFDMSVDDLVAALRGCECVVHLAARVHQMQDKGCAASDEIYAHENTKATERLAQAAMIAGVRNFIFMSTAKVYGNRSPMGRPFQVGDPAQPKGPYEKSKHRAEEILLNMDTGEMAISIIRPPLVYGPGVGANFAALARLAKSRLPLPFGAINNRRSLVSTANLHSLILRLCNAANGKQIYNVSDDDDVSTSELVKLLAMANGRSAHLLNVPQVVIERALAYAGRRDIAERMCGTFQISIAQTLERLNWKPPYSLRDGVRMSVASSTE